MARAQAGAKTAEGWIHRTSKSRSRRRGVVQGDQRSFIPGGSCGRDSLTGVPWKRLIHSNPGLDSPHAQTPMKEFKFACPTCGQHISGSEQWAGAQINCPVCQAQMVVPKL